MAGPLPPVDEAQSATVPPERSRGGAPVTRVSGAGATDPGRVRSVNQDYYFVGDVPGRGYLAVVADGMGGHTAGEVASSRAVQTMVDSLRRSRSQPPVALARAAQAANVEVYNYGLENPHNKGMGTTLTSVLIDDQVGLVGHVGDSRAYLVRGTELTRLTLDHSWVADRVRLGLLSEEEAKRHRWRNVITNAIGATPTFRLDVLYFNVEPGDLVIVVSDGVSMLLDEKRLVQLAAGAAPQEAVAQLLAEANQRGAPDNITAVVLRVDQVAARPKQYDLPGAPLEAASVDIGETLSGIRRVEDGYPSNGPWHRLRRHAWYPYRFWILGSVYLVVLLALFLIWRS
jgi:protein phosphatase